MKALYAEISLNKLNDAEVMKQYQMKYRECMLPCNSVSSVSHLLSKNVKTKIYKTIILPFVLYGWI
jgi:hypothetical protein